MNAGNYLKGLAAGASLMYFFDPDRGARRRSLVRDQFVHLNHKLQDGLGAAVRDARNRSVGMAAKARRRVSRGEAPDAVIEERVRSTLGRVVSHPRSIEVSALGGHVTLSGPVLADEVDSLVSAVRSTSGVDEVENRLEVHDDPTNVPGLQGGTARPRERTPGARPELMQENWTPALRLVVGGLGTATLVGGRRASGLRGVMASAVGSALLARAATNLPTRRWVGVDAGRSGLTFKKTLNIDAPLDEVWDLWSRFETFPQFMAHLDEVRITGEGRSHWVARGVGGSRFEWDAEVTQWEPGEVIAWKSNEGAEVANAGTVRFQPDGSGGTRVDVHLSYNPPAGALGHLFASLFGSDPKHAMDEDMVRLKSLLEQGKASVSGETVTLESLQPEEGVQDPHPHSERIPSP